MLTEKENSQRPFTLNLGPAAVARGGSGVGRWGGGAGGWGGLEVAVAMTCIT